MPSFNQRLGVSRLEADEYYQQALEAYQKRDYDGAVEVLNKALDLLPNKSEYLVARGMIYLDDQDLEKAEADFTAALKAFQYEMGAHYGLGLIAFRRRKFADAVEHLKKAHYADVERPETLYNLSLAYYNHGDLVNGVNYMGMAFEAFEKAGDKRKSEAQRWLKEFQKNSAQAAKTGVPKLPSQQASLPIGKKDT